MRNIIIIQLLIAVLFVSCITENEETVCQGFNLEQPTLNDELDYEIINAVLEADHIDLDFIQIVQETKYSFDGELFKLWLDEEGVDYDAVLLSDYTDKNNESSYLSDNNFQLSTIELIAQTEIECIFSVEAEGWDNYYKKYPKSTGIYSFSRPGINAAGDQAIIMYGKQAHYTSGWDSLIVLIKEDNAWVVSDEILIGLS